MSSLQDYQSLLDRLHGSKKAQRAGGASKKAQPDNPGAGNEAPSVLRQGLNQAAM